MMLGAGEGRALVKTHFQGRAPARAEGDWDVLNNRLPRNSSDLREAAAWNRPLDDDFGVADTVDSKLSAKTAELRRCFRRIHSVSILGRICSLYAALRDERPPL